MKKKKLRILLTSYPPLKESGGAISTYNLSKILRKFGHEVYIASIGKYKDAPTIIIPEYKKIPILQLQKRKSSKIFEKIIRDKNIDIIHSQGWLTDVGSVLAAKRTGIISIVHFRAYDWICPTSSLLRKDGTSYNIANTKEVINNSSLKMMPYNLYKWYTFKSWWPIIKSADGYLAVSKFVRDKMRQIRVKPEVIYSMRVLKGKFNKKKNRKRKIVTFISRLDKQKGTELILKIAPEVVKRNKDTYFYIAGRGPLQKKVEELSHRHKRIKYLGNIPHQKIGELYNKSDIIVFPVQWEEPVGGMPYECIMSGTPLIASKKGGIGEVLLDKKTGFLVPSDNVNEWIKKIKYLLENKKLRIKMGKRAIKEKRKYSIETLGKQIENFYFEVYNKKL